MGNRYADDIKRIVGIDPNQSTLGDPEKKASIDAKRGIGYIDTSSNSAKGTSGTPGSTQLSTDKGEGDTSNGENDAGDTPLDPSSPQNGVNGVNDGIVDVEALIDGTADQAKETAPATTDGGLEYDGSLALSGFTATDCASGKDIEVRLRNDYVPPDAQEDLNGVPTSNDWEDASTPPAELGWQLGYFWSNGFSASQDPHSTWTGVYDFVEGTIASNATIEVLSITDSLVVARIITYNDDTHTPPELGHIDSSIVRQSCSIEPGLSDPVTLCPTEAPTETAWPTSGKYVLKGQEGQYTANQYDSEAPTGATNPSSKVDFCFGAGGARTGSMEVTRNNGHMIYETSGGAPTGVIRAYDSTGQMVAAFDTTVIQSYRPEPAP